MRKLKAFLRCILNDISSIENIAIYIYNWVLQNLGVIKFLIGIDLKVHISQKIDKIMRFVYMATLSDNSGVIFKQNKAAQKAVTWGSLA